MRTYTKRIEKVHRERGTEPDPVKPFRDSMSRAVDETLDLLALTGDIIHFPSPVNVEFVCEQIATLGVPAMYTCGNHDVHYTDEPVNKEIRLTQIGGVTAVAQR